jgi:hypothetical protein
MNFDVIRVLSINIVDHRFQMAQFQGEGSRIRDLDLLILPFHFSMKRNAKKMINFLKYWLLRQR